MSLAVIHSRALSGILAPPVAVEVHLSNGLPSLSIVGLPEAEVRESRDRVRSAILTSNFEFPARRITINLAPADLPKEGGRFDLPIALGILAASGQIPTAESDRYEFLGELALTGELRGIRGTLAAALQAKGAGRALMVPTANADEAALINGTDVFSADHLLAITSHLHGSRRLSPRILISKAVTPSQPDLADVNGQRNAKRALEIAAAGGHSLLMLGPPGSGKTMLAGRLPGILPPMTDEEAVETAAVQSVSHGGFSAQHWKQRPFRSPHHTASGVALVGGGSFPMPGEVSLAHGGVLFLDELPEFDRRVLEVLREPLESGSITISRAARQCDFPARFQLVAAMNPCPCGWLGHESGRCRCTSDQVRNYRGRISGPLLDRIDLQVNVPAMTHSELLNGEHQGEEPSATVRERVVRARNRQLERQGVANHALDATSLRNLARISAVDRHLLETAMRRFLISARAVHRILRVARTVADLDGSDGISGIHLSEAIQLRCLTNRSA